MFEILFKKMDHLICLYLGLEKHDIEKPKSIRFSKTKLILCKNHIFQRHRYQEELDFIEFLTNSTSDANQKIGIAAGNAIAKSLVISFEKVEIKKCP